MGILDEDDRVELLDGDIVEMTPISSDHAGGVNALNALFGARLGDRAVLAVQNPARLDDFNEHSGSTDVRARPTSVDAGHMEAGSW